MAEALGVLDQEHVAGAEGPGLAGRGDLDAAGDANDELAPVLGLLGMASAGRPWPSRTATACQGSDTPIMSGGGSSGNRAISTSSNRA